jgi:hypothetical protein
VVLGAVDPDDFANEFRLMTIQRGLKATGTFSYQTAGEWPRNCLSTFYSANPGDRTASGSVAGSLSYLAADVERTN